jgi:hypothetical protein
MSKRSANFLQNFLKKKKCVIEDNEMVDDPAPISSNQPMKNLDIDLISNQNKGTVENIIIDIGIVLSSKSTIDDFTKKQLLENH